MRSPPPHAEQAQHASAMASDEHDRPNNDTEQAASPPDDKDAIGEQRGDEQEVISAEPAEVESDDDDDEDAEPRFKYANLTSHLGPVFRNGDSASASLVSGDKLVRLYLKGSPFERLTCF